MNLYRYKIGWRHEGDAGPTLQVTLQCLPVLKETEKCWIPARNEADSPAMVRKASKTREWHPTREKAEGEFVRRVTKQKAWLDYKAARLGNLLRIMGLGHLKALMENRPLSIGHPAHGDRDARQAEDEDFIPVGKPL